jgi:hypothetical protein
MRSDAFRPFANVTLTVTAASSQATIPATATHLELNNDGGSTCFVRWGPVAQTAVAATDYPVLSGQCKIITCELGNTSVAAICEAGQATTLRVSAGVGV